MVEFGQLVLGVLPYYLGEAVRLYTTLEQSYSAHPDPPLSLSCHSPTRAFVNPYDRTNLSLVGDAKVANPLMGFTME